MTNIIAYSLSEIDAVAEKILPLLKHKVVIFNGTMGMGKTTLIKALVKALGITDATTSPTFGLVNPYENERVRIFHFDLYRIDNEEEALDIGLDEYLYSGDWCFIEWADKVTSFLPEEKVFIHFRWLDDGKREIEISY
ncbi:MAG: tRNA (adenosine(37)-N6)-threonylcarbamoyltransferase complex ATPase subunit type 1 TsaE [Capnocytophaga sp.]|nr:tRNA (adenosine(37)-N6)-threonylcarbamoyltransferase complex ATPase subunit type 1 TsaE [Capnocytophaga sp.]